MSADARRRRAAAKANPYSRAVGVRIPPPATVTALPVPPPPAQVLDLDAVGDRYTALCETRESGDPDLVRLAAEASADDVPLLRDRVAALTREVAWLTGGPT